MNTVEPDKPRGRWILQYSAALLLGLLFWFLRALSVDYSDTIIVHLSYKLPSGKINAANMPDEARVFVRASGWQLLRSSLSRPAIEIDASDKAGSFSITGEEELNLFLQELPSGFEILNIHPDPIHFELENVMTRKVPVRLNLDFSLEKGFRLIGPVLVRPDSVLLTGASSSIAGITELSTEPVIYKNVSTSLDGIAVLQLSGGSDYRADAIVVSFHVPVGKVDTIQSDSSFINLQH